MTKEGTALFLLPRWSIWRKRNLCSTPAVIGKDGIEDIFELKLTDEELTLFKKSCAVIREYATKAETV